MKDYCTTHFHACDCREEMHREEIEKLRESVEKFKYDYICRRNAAARESDSHSATFTKLETANAKIKQLEEKLKAAEKCLAEAKSVLDSSLVISPLKDNHMSIVRALIKIRCEQKDTDNDNDLL